MLYLWKVKFQTVWQPAEKTGDPLQDRTRYGCERICRVVGGRDGRAAFERCRQDYLGDCGEDDLGGHVCTDLILISIKQMSRIDAIAE